MMEIRWPDGTKKRKKVAKIDRLIVVKRYGWIQNLLPHAVVNSTVGLENNCAKVSVAHITSLQGIYKWTNGKIL